MKFFEVSVNDKAVVVRRTEHRIEEMEAFVNDFAKLNEKLEQLAARTEGLRVLLDLREAIGRNDSGFEAAVAPHRKRMFSSHWAIAVLVKTSVGAMQVGRHLQMDGVDAPVFADEDVASTWLRGL